MWQWAGAAAPRQRASCKGLAEWEGLRWGWGAYNRGMVGPERIEVRIVTGDEDWQAALAVRREVFIVEQGVPAEIEQDDSDATAIHVVASCDGEIVGTARLTRDDETRIGRVAVLPSRRRRGVAGMMLASLEEEARKLGLSEVSLHSQNYVQSLYHKLGYEIMGPPFVEAGIDHVPMSKRLS